MDCQWGRLGDRSPGRRSTVLKRALSGLQAWIVQRVTAAYMLLFLFYALLCFTFDPPASYIAWREWVTRPLVTIATVLFFGVLLLHAWIGLRDVAMDYIRPVPIRLFFLSGLAIVLSGLGIWVARVLLLAG